MVAHYKLIMGICERGERSLSQRGRKTPWDVQLQIQRTWRSHKSLESNSCNWLRRNFLIETDKKTFPKLQWCRVAVDAVAMAINSIKVHRVRVLMALEDNEVPHYHHHENVTCISFHLSFPSLSLLDADELN